jgi:hypothetical protein
VKKNTLFATVFINADYVMMAWGSKPPPQKKAVAKPQPSDIPQRLFNTVALFYG